MAHPNPYYEPDWKTFHHRRRAKLERAREEFRRLSEAEDCGSDAYAAAKAEHRRRHEAFMLTYKMRHPTVQEYAEWVFGEFPVGMEGFAAGVLVPKVDFTAFRTLEEVDAAWARIDRAVSDAAWEKRNSLPAGQPLGMTAFADPGSPRLVRTWRHFLPEELYPGSHGGETGVRTLITADEQEDGWHVCFMQDWNSAGPSVTNAIERLATAFYRGATAGRWPPARWPARLIRRLARHRRVLTPDPGRFHFYQHRPPRAAESRETFDHVRLRFFGGEYRDPEWFSYRVIPKAIGSARLDCAKAAPPSRRHVELFSQRKMRCRP